MNHLAFVIDLLTWVFVVGTLAYVLLCFLSRGD